MSYVGGRLLKIICTFARTMVNETEPESSPTSQAAVHETPTDTSGDPSTPNAILNYLTSWLPGGAGMFLALSLENATDSNEHALA